MVSGLFHIKINGNEENKDEGFYALMTSGASVFCLENEEYVVPEEAIKKLKEKDIDFEPVKKEEVAKENKENAAKT